MRCSFCKYFRLLVASIVLVFALPSFGRKVVLPDSLLLRTITVGDVVFRMRFVPAGTFVMGATPEQHSDYGLLDSPAHSVSLDSYYIAETEVTQALWRELMPEWKSPEKWFAPDAPVGWISWYDAQCFVRRLDSVTGLPFRLPTEAEWEYAARGGETGKAFTYAGHNRIDSVAWYYSNAGNRIHPVAQKRPNMLGLYDMTGNVKEWCLDWLSPYVLATAPNPKGPTEGKEKVLRGGSFDNCKENSHLSVRFFETPDHLANDCGLRLVLVCCDSFPNLLQRAGSDDSSERVFPLSIRLRVGHRSQEFRLVDDSVPFYIADADVTCKQWKEVLADAEVEQSKMYISGVRRSEQIRFVERVHHHIALKRKSDEPLYAVSIATDVELQKAIEKGVVDSPDQQKRRRIYNKSLAQQQRHRQHLQKMNVFTEEVLGIQLAIPDDPVLNVFSEDPVQDGTFRLVVRCY